MKRSETIGKLAEALAKAQSEFSPAPYDAKNPHFNSKYASLASIIEATKPMHKQGLSASQSLEIIDGRVNITTLLLHVSGEWIESTLSMKPRTDSPQDTGSAATYGRRYGLAAILGICSDDDDDGNAASIPNKQKPASKPASNPEPQKPVEVKAPEAKPIEPANQLPTERIATAKNNTAEELANIRTMVIDLGIKTREDYFATVSSLAHRDLIKDVTDLTPEQRKAVIAALTKMLAEKKEGESTNG